MFDRDAGQSVAIVLGDRVGYGDACILRGETCDRFGLGYAELPRIFGSILGHRLRLGLEPRRDGERCWRGRDSRHRDGLHGPIGRTGGGGNGLRAGLDR